MWKHQFLQDRIEVRIYFSAQEKVIFRPFQSGNPSEFKTERQKAQKLRFLNENNILGVAK